MDKTVISKSLGIEMDDELEAFFSEGRGSSPPARPRSPGNSSIAGRQNFVPTNPITLNSAGAYSRRTHIIQRLNVETKLPRRTVQDIVVDNMRRKKTPKSTRIANIRPQVPGTEIPFRPRGGTPIVIKKVNTSKFPVALNSRSSRRLSITPPKGRSISMQDISQILSSMSLFEDSVVTSSELSAANGPPSPSKTRSENEAGTRTGSRTGSRIGDEYYSRPAYPTFLSSGVQYPVSFTQSKKLLRPGPLNKIRYPSPSAINCNLQNAIIPRYADDILEESHYASISTLTRRKFYQDLSAEDRLYLAKRRQLPQPYLPKISDLNPPFKVDYEERGSPLRKQRDVFKVSPVGFF